MAFSSFLPSTEQNLILTGYVGTNMPVLSREIAEYLGLRPVLEGQYDARLSAFPVIQSDRGRVIVHVVNCDVDYEQDTIGAQQDVRVSIRTPDFLHDVNSGVLYNCKTGMDVPIAVYHRLGRLEMTIPELGRGAVVVIAGDD